MQPSSEQNPDQAIPSTEDNIEATALGGPEPASGTQLDNMQAEPVTTIARMQAPESDDASMDRVIDVPLTVTLRFGQRHMSVRELLELNTGSLVELDQQVDEPVHLMLGERVIARGEVVIVDGNYGMRVLEVVEHAATQRLSAMGAL